VIDFSFYVTEPAYACAAMQSIVNGYSIPGILVCEWLEVWKRRVVAANDKELADIAGEDTAPPESARSPKWRLARQMARELRQLGSSPAKKANAPFFLDGWTELRVRSAN
jgi:hypothetical protein